MITSSVQEDWMRIGDIKDFGFDWRSETFNYRAPGSEYSGGTHLRALIETGFEYVVIGNGQTGNREPRYPLIAGTRVKDGSISLECAPLSFDGLFRRISNSTWNCESPSIVLTSLRKVDSVATQATIVDISPTAAGIYDIVNTVTLTDGKKLSKILRLTVANAP